MSGKKRIMVDESEWYRLQRQASRLGEIKRSLPKLIADVRRQSQADLERVFGQMETRQQRVEQVVGSLGEATRRIEADTNRRLREQGQRMEETLRNSVGELRDETRELLAEQEGRWRTELSEERRQRREEVNQLSRTVGALSEERERAVASADAWLADAQAVHDLIRDNLDHARFAPGQLASLERRLATARQNLEQGSGMAALAVAQGAYHDLSDLRLELELREREWRVLQAAAGEALLVVEGLIDQNTSRPVQGQDGGDLPGVILDVDYWSDNELSRLREEVAAASQRVRDEDTPMSLEELRAMVDDGATEFERRIAAIVERAGLRQLASQLRVNLADAVAQTLDEVAGYELVDGTYAGEDQRAAFYAKLAHQNGNQIVVDVSPDSEEPGRCVLRVLSYDHDVTAEEELVERAREIVSGLQERGLRAEAPETEAGVPEPALRDFESIRRAAPRPVTRP
jgi:hypothetical protein